MIRGKDYFNNIYENADARLALYNIMHAAAEGEIDISDEQLKAIFVKYFEACRSNRDMVYIDPAAIDRTVKEEFVLSFLDLIVADSYQSYDNPYLRTAFWFYSERKIIIPYLIMHVLNNNATHLRNQQFFWTIMATALLYAPTDNPSTFVKDIISIIDK